VLGIVNEYCRTAPTMKAVNRLAIKSRTATALFIVEITSSFFDIYGVQEEYYEERVS